MIVKFIQEKQYNVSNQTLTNTAGAESMQVNVDIFDLIYHTAPSILLMIIFFRDGSKR